MSHSTIIVGMDAQDRAATEAYLADLEREFRENAEVMRTAKSARWVGRYAQCVEKSRTLYREISEVEFALASGILPF